MYKTILLALVLVFLLSFNVFAQDKTGVNLLTPEEKTVVKEFLKEGREIYEGLRGIGKDYEQVFVRIEYKEKRKSIIFLDIHQLTIISLYVDEVMDRVVGGSVSELAYEYAITIDAILASRYSKGRRLI